MPTTNPVNVSIEVLVKYLNKQSQQSSPKKTFTPYNILILYLGVKIERTNFLQSKCKKR